MPRVSTTSAPHSPPGVRGSSVDSCEQPHPVALVVSLDHTTRSRLACGQTLPNQFESLDFSAIERR
jgi:hypothetical protein